MVVGSRNSIGLAGMSAVKAVVAAICGTPDMRVTITEHGKKKVKYDVKVYLESTQEVYKRLPKSNPG